MSVIHTNNCIRYVKDQKVSLYLAMYCSKYTTDDRDALSEAVDANERYRERARARSASESTSREEHSSTEPQAPKTDYSIGMGKLVTAVRASTKEKRLEPQRLPFA